MDDAAGAADDEMRIIEESIDYKLNKLQQTWVGVLQEILQRKDIANIVDGLTSISNGIGGVISELGLLGTALTAGSFAVGIKSISKFMTKDLPVIKAAYAQLMQAGNVMALSNEQLVMQLAGLTDAQSRVLLGTLGLKNARVEEIMALRGQTEAIISLTAAEATRLVVVDAEEEEEKASVLAKIEAAAAEGTLTQAKLLDIIASSGLSKTTKANIVNNLGLIGSNEELKLSYDKLTGSILKANLAILKSPWTWLIAAIAGFIYVTKKAADGVENFHDKVHDLGEGFSETKKDIDEYKQKIRDLNKVINDEDSSTEEVIQARKDLLGIQDDLISKYGNEKTVIDAVNGSLQDQADLLDTISDKEWRDIKNKMNNNDDWGLALDNKLMGYKDNVDRMYHEMSNVTGMINFTGDTNKYAGVYDIFKRNGFYLEMNESLGQILRSDNRDRMELQDDLDRIQDELERYIDANGLQNDTLINQLSQNITNAINENDSFIQKYSAYWSEYIAREIIKKDKDLSSTGDNLRSLYKTYQDAFKKYGANDPATQTALRETAEALSVVLDNSDIPESVRKYFKDLYKVAYAEVSDWKIYADVVPQIDTTAFEDLTEDEIVEKVIESFSKTARKNNADRIFKLKGRWSDDLNIQMDEYDEAFDLIISSAIQYGKVLDTDTDKLEFIISVLKKWGIIQDKETQKASQGNGFTGLTDKQSEKLDDYQSKLDKLSDTLDKIKKGELTASDKLDLEQEFSELDLSQTNIDEQIRDLISQYTSEIKSALKLELTDDDNLYRDYITAKQFEMPEVEEYLERLKERAKELGITLDEFLNQEHERLGLIDLLNEVDKAAKRTTMNLSDAFSNIKNSASIFKEFKEAKETGKVTSSILDSVAGLSDELNTLVAGYYGGVAELDDIYNALEKKRQEDFENYKEAYVAKQNLDETYYKNAIKINEELIKNYQKLYQTNLNLYNSFEEAKFNTFENLMQARANILADYFHAEATSMKTMLERYYDYGTGKTTTAYDELYARIRSGTTNEDERKIYEQVKTFLVDYPAAIEELKRLGLKDIEDIVDINGFADNLSDAASDYSDLFDFFERRIEVITQALDKLDASLEEVNSSAAKNTLINGKINIVQEEIKDYSSALKMYEELAANELAKLPADIQEKIKNGAIDVTKFVGENGEEINKVISEYQNWANKVDDCNQQLITLKETLRDLALDRFNNIAQEFSDRFDLIGSSNSLIEKQISLFEEAGQVVGEAFYRAQISSYEEQRKTLKDEQSKLIADMTSSIASGIIQKGTDEWLEMGKTIQEVDENILDCEQSIEQMNNAILELSDQAFERLQNRFDDIKNQLSNIAGMIDGDEFKVSDEEGIWSNEGLTRLGLAAQEFELARNNVEEYQKEIDRINDAYNQGLYSTTEYIDKISELTQAQWEEANSAEDAKQSIVDLNKARVDAIKEGIQKQIDALKELTDKQKEALDKEKDLRDYEKSIAEKNKSIAKIQNQLSALANDTSASANAKRIKLQQELSDAIEELTDAQYDHSVETQKEALDQQMEDFEEEKNEEIKQLEEYLENVELVFSDSLSIIKQHTEEISATIEQIAEKHGVHISDAIANAWRSGENAIAAYGEELSSETSAFIGELDEVEEELTQLTLDANATADALVNVFNVSSSKLLNEFDAALNSVNDLTTATNLLNQALINTLSGNYSVGGVVGAIKKVTDTTGSGSKDNGGNVDDTDDDDKKKTPPKKSKDEIDQQYKGRLKDLNYEFNASGYGQYYAVNENWSNGSNTALWTELDNRAHYNPYDSEANNLSFNVKRAIKDYEKKLEELKKEYAETLKFYGYASGVYNLKRSETAWTQENGMEAILSPTRNAVLTKLNKGDTVLTAAQTKNLFKWGKISPETLIKNSALLSVSSSKAPTLEIGNVITINGNVDDTNIEKMKVVAANAINTAFKKFSDEIIKR